jgi:hypothetical protein
MQEIYGVHMLVLIPYIMKFCSALTAAFYALQLTSIKSSTRLVKILLLAALCVCSRLLITTMVMIIIKCGGSSSSSSSSSSSKIHSCPWKNRLSCSKAGETDCHTILILREAQNKIKYNKARQCTYNVNIEESSCNHRCSRNA